MSQKDNKTSENLVNNNSNHAHQSPRDAAKSRIMEKFDVSPDVAENILSKLEKKEFEKNKKQNNINSPFDSRSNKQDLRRNNHPNTVFQNHISDGKITNINSKNSIDNEIHSNNNQRSTINGQKKNKDINEKSHNKSLPISDSKTDSFNNLQINKKQNSLILSDDDSIKDNSEVDSILGEIIPNYNQQISIKLDHVDLTFEVSNEKIDTLKETFIRALKRNKSKKIKIHALNDVSFQIYKGEKVGIIGYNGAGKSTLLNVITGIYPPDKGTVTTFGKISPLLSLGAGFDYNFSGRKNIIINGAVLGYDRKFLESKMDEIIEFSELGEFIDIPIKNYSSGMLAKLGFSIATIVNPDILIIDEILGVGDVNFHKKSADKIKSLMDGGTTVLLVSHSIPQIRELCDKAIWMDKGHMRAIGEVNKVCDEYLKDAEKASNKELANIKLTN